MMSLEPEEQTTGLTDRTVVTVGTLGKFFGAVALAFGLWFGLEARFDAKIEAVEKRLRAAITDRYMTKLEAKSIEARIVRIEERVNVGVRGVADLNRKLDRLTRQMHRATRRRRK